MMVPPEQSVGAARIKARTSTGLVVDAAVAFRFRREDFDAVAGKFVRGLHYHRTGTPLPVTSKVIAFDPPPEVMKEAAQLPGGSLSDGLL